MAFTTLISCAQLDERLKRCVVFDCRHDLAQPEAGAAAYAVSHIPGARFMHLDRDLSGVRTGRNGRHPLPEAGAFEKKLRISGVDNDSQVVAYDDSGGLFAVRLWWMLRWLGHEAVAVLDGRLAQWLAEGRPLSARPPSLRPGNFTARPQPGDHVDAPYVLAHLDGRGMQLIDARAADRFRGENEILDPVAGHIPGALNRPLRDNLDAHGNFKPAGELRADFLRLLEGRDPAQVVHQCGSGVTACHNLLAMEIAGLAGSKLYPGSWSEWCADPARPIAKGNSSATQR